MCDNWHRIEKVVKWTGLSVNAFARVIGLNRAENLYQIKRGNNGISRELAETIASRYPSISKGWLLSGEGEMFVEQQSDTVNKIPYFNRDVTGLIISGLWVDKHSDIQLPTTSVCDFAANYIGESMKPDIPSGAIVLCKRVTTCEVVLGGVYLIVAKNFTGVRSLRSSDDRDTFRAVPSNTAQFDTLTIEKSSIESLYQVVAVIINTI